MSELPREGCAVIVKQLLLLMGLLLVVGVWVDECQLQEGMSVQP